MVVVLSMGATAGKGVGVAWRLGREQGASHESRAIGGRRCLASTPRLGKLEKGWIVP